MAKQDFLMFAEMQSNMVWLPKSTGMHLSLLNRHMLTRRATARYQHNQLQLAKLMMTYA